jgi:hypothetical protein
MAEHYFFDSHKGKAKGMFKRTKEEIEAYKKAKIKKR